ncbi:MAG: M1 family aminopeptidase, partial [Bacteroidota bacterium]
VASGAAVSDSVASGRRYARFVLDGDSPPYTFAFAVADFDITDQDAAVPVRHALLAGEPAGGLSRTPEALAVLTDLLGPYPYAGYMTVQVPMVYAGMENVTASFLRADLYRTEATGRTIVEEVNLHELVHQWWGNAIVPSDWRDLWLAEGAATYFTNEAYRLMDGEDAGRRYLTLMSRSISAEDAARVLAPSAYDDPADVLTPTVYQKGGAVFHLLRLTLGEDVFYEAIRQLGRDFADRPLATDGFRAALEEASGRDLGPLFDRWVRSEGLPTLRARWDEPTRTLSWSIEGDDGTLDGVPFEVLIRQGDESWFVPATDGVFSPAGDRRPTIEPVGILLTVEQER